MLQADPDQIAEDVAAVETFLKEEPEKRLAFLLADRCKIDQPEQAKKVLLAEKLSALVRSMALLSLLIDLLTNRKTEFHKADSARLWTRKGPRARRTRCSIAARRPTPQWATLLATYRRAIQFFEIADKLKAQVHKLKVLKPDQLQFEQFHQLWNDDKANRLDYYTSGLRRLVQVGDILPMPQEPVLAATWHSAGRLPSRSSTRASRPSIRTWMPPTLNSRTCTTPITSSGSTRPTPR